MKVSNRLWPAKFRHANFCCGVGHTQLSPTIISWQFLSYEWKFALCFWISWLKGEDIKYQKGFVIYHQPFRSQFNLLLCAKWTTVRRRLLRAQFFRLTRNFFNSYLSPQKISCYVEWTWSCSPKAHNILSKPGLFVIAQRPRSWVHLEMFWWCAEDCCGPPS